MAEAQVDELTLQYDLDGVELSIDQLAEAEAIIETFKQELLDDPGPAMVDFHFGCNSDRIEWDDQDFSHMEIVPRVTIGFDFEELGGGRFNAITPEGLANLLFEGRNRKQFEEELLAALVLERDRVAHGRESDLHLEKIQRYMNKARRSILTSLRAEIAKWE